MSEFFKDRETMKAEIDASYKSLVEKKKYLNQLLNGMSWIFAEKDQLERTAAKFDQLNAGYDEAEIGEIEIDVDNAMTLLNEKFKEVNRKLAVIPVEPLMPNNIYRETLESRNQFEKTACDIVEYKFKKNGKVNVEECYELENPREGFATTTLISTTQSPVKIELRTLRSTRNNEFTHRINKIFQGKKCVFSGGIVQEQLIAINGRYLTELNHYEVEAVIRKQIATGKVVLEVVQWKREGETNSIAFVPIDKQNAAIETSTGSSTEPIINLQENKVVSTGVSEKKENYVNVKRVKLTANPPTCTVSAAGGVSTHQLANSGTEKLVFKVKSSNNNEYRIKPIYGFVEPGASTALQATRTAGAPKEDKLVVHFGPAPVDATDATAVFKEIKDTVDETITIPLVATE